MGLSFGTMTFDLNDLEGHNEFIKKSSFWDGYIENVGRKYVSYCF